MISPGTDLRAVIAKSLDKGPRGDEAHAHVSDLGNCLLQVHARRSGKPELPFDTGTLWKFQLGHAVEKIVADAIIEAARPVPFLRNTRIAWTPTITTPRYLQDAGHFVATAGRDPDEPGLVEIMERCAGCGACQPNPGELIGHIDLDAPTMVGEVKSIWFAGTTLRAAKPAHIVQAASYATARDVPSFFIQYAVVTIHGNRTAVELAPTFWFPTEKYSAQVIALGNEVLEQTDPQTYAPPEQPREPWQCRYCRFAACSKNENPLNPKFARR